jgi:hypothetical protein
MDANKILSTELIDLIFEGRNKSYGLTNCAQAITNGCVFR